MFRGFEGLVFSQNHYEFQNDGIWGCYEKYFLSMSSCTHCSEALHLFSFAHRSYQYVFQIINESHFTVLELQEKPDGIIALFSVCVQYFRQITAKSFFLLNLLKMYVTKLFENPRSKKLCMHTLQIFITHKTLNSLILSISIIF